MTTPALADAMAALRASVENLGAPPEAGSELLLLASAAVRSVDGRRTESIDAWAKTLAHDVGDATD